MSGFSIENEYFNNGRHAVLHRLTGSANVVLSAAISHNRTYKFEVRNALRNDVKYCRLDGRGGYLCLAKAMAAVVDFRLFLKLHNFR